MNVIITAIAVIYCFSSFAFHSKEEAQKMVKWGVVDTSSMIIKFHENSDEIIYDFWNLKNIQSFKTETLFTELINSDDPSPASENLKGFQEVKFAAPLSQQQALELLDDLFSQSNIEYAIFNPLVTEAGFTSGEKVIVDNEHDFESLQFHLDPAPIGVDARFAWELPGGAGEGVRIIDMETGINAEHEDLETFFHISKLPKGKVDHGTAVAGELVAKRDNHGVTGIVYEAQFGFVSRLVNNEATWGQNGCKPARPDCSEQEENPYHKGVAANLAKIVEMLQPGDLIVLEMHSPGPRKQFIPVEYWNPVFRILKYATEKGIHCVAAAGNGFQDLDHADYKQAFDLNHRDSGCILVGAAMAGQKNRHQRASFSNHGSRVDAFGYGEKVVTTGYGDLKNGTNSKYTASFSGTSSATPIVGGAMVALSGMAKARGVDLSPLKIREALRATGTKQQDPENGRIGNLPDLKALTSYLFIK